VVCLRLEDNIVAATHTTDRVSLQVAVSDVVNAEKCFSTLANLITSKVPHSRLAVLLGDRLLTVAVLHFIIVKSQQLS